MKKLLLLMTFSFLAMGGLSSMAYAAPAAYQTGVLRITVPDTDGSFDVMVWYPSFASEVNWQLGPYTISSSLNAAIAEDRRFPVVLLSHGSGGTPLGHRELAASLARRGFVVIAPTHLGDTAGHPRAKNQAQILMARPRQAVEALNATLADSRFLPHIDPARIGMLGYSAGGYTALVLAGARPNFEAAAAYCAGDGRNDFGSCGPAGDHTTDVPYKLKTWQPPTEPRLRALVLMDPLSMLFDSAGLTKVRLPILLLRPEDDSYLNATHNALALARYLSNEPKQIVVPGRHFIFVDPCPEKIASQAARICQDAPGIDRVTIHRKMESEVADFLEANL